MKWYILNSGNQPNIIRVFISGDISLALFGKLNKFGILISATRLPNGPKQYEFHFHEIENGYMERLVISAINTLSMDPRRMATAAEVMNIRPPTVYEYLSLLGGKDEHVVFRDYLKRIGIVDIPQNIEEAHRAFARMGISAGEDVSSAIPRWAIDKERLVISVPESHVARQFIMHSLPRILTVHGGACEWSKGSNCEWLQLPTIYQIKYAEDIGLFLDGAGVLRTSSDWIRW